MIFLGAARGRCWPRTRCADERGARVTDAAIVVSILVVMTSPAEAVAGPKSGRQNATPNNVGVNARAVSEASTKNPQLLPVCANTLFFRKNPGHVAGVSHSAIPADVASSRLPWLRDPLKEKRVRRAPVDAAARAAFAACFTPSAGAIQPGEVCVVPRAFWP